MNRMVVAAGLLLAVVTGTWAVTSGSRLPPDVPGRIEVPEPDRSSRAEPGPALTVPTSFVRRTHDLATIWHPAGWHSTARELAQDAQSDSLVSVATLDLEDVQVHEGDCRDAPESALEAMGDMDAFLTIHGPYSAEGAADLQEVGHVYDPKSVGTSDAVHACADNGQTLTDFVIEFRSGTERYTALMVFGPDADELKPSMWLVLNSFRRPATPADE